MKTLSVFVFFCLFNTVTSSRADTTSDASCKVPAPGTPAANSPIYQGTPEEIFKRLYAEAECLRIKAASVGAEWLETEKLLKRSFEESTKNQMDKASELAIKAHLQAVQALQQADREAEAWRFRVIQ